MNTNYKQTVNKEYTNWSNTQARHHTWTLNIRPFPSQVNVLNTSNPMAKFVLL